MKTILLILMGLLVAHVAIARYVTKDFDCDDPDNDLHRARRVQFFTGEGIYERCYYEYDLMCDGSVVGYWMNGLHPAIGHVPTWAEPFALATPSVSPTTGVYTDEIMSNGHLAATITFDQIEGHEAVVTTYPNPLQ